MFILDTNVVSELRKVRTGRAEPNLAAWAASAPQSQMFLSVITVLELEQGVLLIERKDATRGEVIRTWLDEYVLPHFKDRILPVGSRIALRCASLLVPRSRPERDALIAATALVHGMSVVTRNVTDFKPMGVSLINPWAAP